MEAATLKMIASLAEHWGAYYAAKGIANIMDDPPLGAAELAASAALFAIAGGLSGAAGAISKGGSSGSSSSTSSTSTPAAGQPTQQPVTTINVQKFGDGGLITQPTLAIVGEQPEVILPLRNDDAALSLMADKISQHLNTSGGGGGGSHIVMNIQGVISPDNLNRVLRRASQMVNKGQARLNSSNAAKVTRRA
jgi:hypothetical protein